MFALEEACIDMSMCQVLMLEKSRVVKRPEGEPTFHVFYQMLAGIDTELRSVHILQSHEQ